MPTPRSNEFTAYEFSEEEALQAQVLSPLQEMWIQSMLADAASSKIKLTATRAEYDSYWQQEAELQGQIGILSSLLAQSQEAKEKIREIIQEHSANSQEPDPQSPSQIFSQPQ